MSCQSCADANREIDAKEDRLLALEAENKSLKGQMAHFDKLGYVCLLHEKEAAEAREQAQSTRLTDLEAALRQHGKHPSSCPKGTGIGLYKPPADAKCNCGIDAALLHPETAAAPEERG